MPKNISALTKHELKDEWKKSIKKGNPEGDHNLYQAFTLYRRVLKSVINSAKNSHSCNKILENKHDRKKMWRVINDLRGKYKKEIKPSFVIDNQKIFDRRIIANKFNEYFNSIASNLNESLGELPIRNMEHTSFEDFLMPLNKNSIFLDDCTHLELMEIISDLDNNKSSDIPIRIIKKSAHIICHVLALH